MSFDINPNEANVYFNCFTKAAESLKHPKHNYILEKYEVGSSKSGTKLNFTEVINLFNNTVAEIYEDYKKNEQQEILESFKLITENFKKKEQSLYTKFIYWIKGTSKDEIIKKAESALKNFEDKIKESDNRSTSNFWRVAEDSEDEDSDDDLFSRDSNFSPKPPVEEPPLRKQTIDNEISARNLTFDEEQEIINRIKTILSEVKPADQSSQEEPFAAYNKYLRELEEKYGKNSNIDKLVKDTTNSFYKEGQDR